MFSSYPEEWPVNQLLNLAAPDYWMEFIFTVCLAGFILVLIPYFLSLEHWRLRRLFGEERGILVGDALGVVSGWGFFGFWIGLWFAPQGNIPPAGYAVSILGAETSVVYLLLSLFFLVPAFWLGLGGVRELGLKVSETHRPVKVVSSGVYGLVRHPQYLGGFLGHLGVSLLLSSRDSLFVTPLVVCVVYLISWKEEVELVNMFRDEYRDYQGKVPMLIPRLGAPDSQR
jgi:protein-S-isoprenylcysteine O-methyltransferase Ste14